MMITKDREVTVLGCSKCATCLMSPLTIPNGSTLTVDYELVVRLSPDTQDTETDGSNGGFLQSFMGSIRDIAIGDSNGVDNSKANYFRMKDKPGIDRHIGIRLGDDNQFTSMTDAGLNIQDDNRNGYEHGEEDGQLWHYGNDVTAVQYDKANNKATFEIYRIFENRGSTDLVVREKGLWATDKNGNSQMIARMALDSTDEFTIAAGEYKKVKFIVEVIA
ncbi:hypothetical protein [Fodinibius sp.]|uniref:hypothetical protein n=1 Tax=Fodinibius sp. TaxID=1872440 RepID=UPI002ACDA2F6|nr:hypothetical protein [Fodinibius sp.]MDZ7658836.1 hypothetical protein [Fodinibius sp.]